MASIVGNGAKGHHKFTLVVNQKSQSVANNTSEIEFTFQISPIQTSWNWEQWSSITYTITINGTNYTGSIPNYDGYSTVTLKSGTQTVWHNNDGTKAISFSFFVDDNAGQYYTPGDAGASGSLTLSTIARASQPSCITYPNTTEHVGNIGGTFTIHMNRASSSFLHYVYCVWGNKNVPIASNVADNCTFTIPEDFGNDIPSSMEGWGTIYVDTYNNGTYIGTKTIGFKATVPDYTPWANISAWGNNLLDGTYVQGVSTVSASVEAYSEYGAWITSYYAIVDDKEYFSNNFTSSVLSNGDKVVKVAFWDTRGKQGYIESSWFTVQPYWSPTVTKFNVERDSNNPTTVYAYVEGNIAPIDNKNYRLVAVDINGVIKNLTLDSYNVSQTVTYENVPTDNTLNCKVAFQDSYIYIETVAVLPTVAVTMDFHYSGKGVAFGKVAESENTLDVAWKIKNNSVPTLLGGLGTPITNGSNLNSTAYIDPGNYVCSLNDIAKTVVNSPTSVAFKMRVYDCLGTMEDMQFTEWAYIVREITDYNGFSWIQYVRREGGDWYFAPWRVILDSASCPSYVIEHGWYDGWEYTRWNTGKLELYSERWVDFPAAEKQGDFQLWRSIAQLDLSNWFTNIWSGTCSVQVNGMVPQLCRHSQYKALAEIVIVTSRSFDAFGTVVPIYIVGGWN